uniref:DUF8040 domain-containing protein n=1 Tax=Lactuca sativa TaxID=4236 RepID=A0A9R1WNE5_LACSA|nr:hypothetical protein LSAT_V11C100011940 [Lactuca sativa]
MELCKKITRMVLESRLSLTTRNRRQRQTSLILTWWDVVLHVVVVLLLMIFKKHRDKRCIKHLSSNVDRYPILHRYVYESDTMSISQIRMSQMCFTKLCCMLETLGGLKPSRNMEIDEQVAINLHILAHNVKNRVIICRFRCSGETINRHFIRLCNAVIGLHTHLLKKPAPVPDNSTDQRWKWFKNWLGALDGTYIKCLVTVEDQPRYRTRKNDIATNVLGFVPKICKEVSRTTAVQHDETSPSVRSKKKKIEATGFNKAVGLIIESLKEISKDLSEGIKFDMKINELSEKIPPAILKTNSISQLEKFKALTKIRSDPINVQKFWEIEECDREAWVKYILEGTEMSLHEDLKTMKLSSSEIIFWFGSSYPSNFEKENISSMEIRVKKEQ